jgi:plasmid stabilization system protein ParE
MNPNRTQSLIQIRDVLARSGPAAAVRVARAAFEAGRIDALDVPEVYLALQARSEGFFDKLCAHAPGGSRFPFAPA